MCLIFQLSCSLFIQSSFDLVRVVDETVPHLLDTFKPDIVLYDAGVDPHIDDDLGTVDTRSYNFFVALLVFLDSPNN